MADSFIKRLGAKMRTIYEAVGTENVHSLVVYAKTEATAPVGTNLQQIGGNTVNVGAGNVGTGTLRATLAANDPAVVSLAILDDWDESDRAKVNPIAGQAGVAAGSGAADALTQRVISATDDPGVALLGTIDADTSLMVTALTNAFAQLTAPGSTTGFAVGICTRHALQYTVATIDTNVVVRAEGSLDNTNWFNCDEAEEDTTQVANGTYAMKFTGPWAYVRLTFVSESGGTAATIDAVYRGLP